MSPECLNIKKSSRIYSAAANDVWSCGVLLINLLFGKNPWQEPTMNDQIYARYIAGDPRILTRQFRLSKDMESILAYVFAPESSRLDVQDLKHAVLGVESFCADVSQTVNGMNIGSGGGRAVFVK